MYGYTLREEGNVYRYTLQEEANVIEYTVKRVQKGRVPRTISAPLTVNEYPCSPSRRLSFDIPGCSCMQPPPVHPGLHAQVPSSCCDKMQLSQ
jgi:hypothetical protein